jgi:hypothetical protein
MTSIVVLSVAALPSKPPVLLSKLSPSCCHVPFAIDIGYCNVCRTVAGSSQDVKLAGLYSLLELNGGGSHVADFGYGLVFSQTGGVQT